MTKQNKTTENSGSFEFLEKWMWPDCYMGATWENWFVVYYRNRDSDLLTESNFEEIQKALEPLQSDIEDEGEEMKSVQTIRENHWAVGWVEWIGIHQSNTAALEEAERLLERIDCYPVLNEDAFSAKEWAEYERSWKDYGSREFIREIKKQFEIKDTTENFLDFLDPYELTELYEQGIPSGEYFTTDNSGVSLSIKCSVDKLEREELAAFLKEQRVKKKSSAAPTL